MNEGRQAGTLGWCGFVSWPAALAQSRDIRTDETEWKLRSADRLARSREALLTGEPDVASTRYEGKATGSGPQAQVSTLPTDVRGLHHPPGRVSIRSKATLAQMDVSGSTLMGLTTRPRDSSSSAQRRCGRSIRFIVEQKQTD